MIKISHINGDEKVVTQGAFESIFKPLGYKIVADKNKETKVEVTGKEEKEIKSVEETKEKVIETPKEVKSFGKDKDYKNDKRK